MSERLGRRAMGKHRLNCLDLSVTNHIVRGHAKPLYLLIHALVYISPYAFTIYTT
jgi:hypothetical protein